MTSLDWILAGLALVVAAVSFIGRRLRPQVALILDDPTEELVSPAVAEVDRHLRMVMTTDMNAANELLDARIALTKERG